jgi:hypothetical protein
MTITDNSRNPRVASLVAWRMVTLLLVILGDRLWSQFRPVKIVQIREAAMPESLKQSLGVTGSNLLNRTAMPYSAATNGPITPKDLRQIRATLTWQGLAPFHASEIEIEDASNVTVIGIQVLPWRSYLASLEKTDGDWRLVGISMDTELRLR